MEIYFKRYFWTARLAFIASAALLITRSANSFVGTALEPAPLLPIDSAPRQAMPAAIVTVDPVRFGHLFGIDPPPPPPPEPTVDEIKQNTTVCYTCEPVKTNLRLQLLATMVASDKRWSLALISDLDAQKADNFATNDRVNNKNATIYDIQREPQRVVIVNEDTHRLEYIDNVAGSGAAVNTAGLGNLGTAPVPAPTNDGEGGPIADVPVEGIKKVSDGKYSISRAKLDSTLANLNDVATQARIVPSFKNGVGNGFKLFSIRPGSLYSAIGVQNGDVITRINGFDINSPEKALEIYTRLKDAKNVKIDYERHGQTMTSDYSIE